jgi:hypothetical protein
VFSIFKLVVSSVSSFTMMYKTGHKSRAIVIKVMMSREGYAGSKESKSEKNKNKKHDDDDDDEWQYIHSNVRAFGESFTSSVMIMSCFCC